MSRYREEVAAALQAVSILGPTRYAWLGRRSRALPRSLEDQMTEPERRRYLVSCLREELYSSFYCYGSPVPARWGIPEPVSADPWLVAAMSAANHADGGWEPGWTVERMEGDEVVATSSRLRVRVAPVDCLSDNGALRPGSQVSLRLPKELGGVSPGFFTVVGGAVAKDMAAGIVRVYWNVGAARAPALVRTLTTELSGREVPYRLKVADHPVRLKRSDAAVLYVAADRFGELRAVMGRVARGLASSLGSSTPALTRELAPGVGTAEDSDASESFGTSRCALIADGVVTAHDQGIVDPDGRLQAVIERFTRAGVSIDQPYLEPLLAGRHVL